MPLKSAWHRHRVFRATVGGHTPEARRWCWSTGLSRAGEHDALAVGCPAGRRIGSGMPREARRFTAVDRYRVDVGIPAVRAGERHRASIWRQPGLRGVALERRQSPRLAAGAFDDPDVAGVRKRNMTLADRGLSQQQCFLRRRSAGRETEHDGGDNRATMHCRSGGSRRAGGWVRLCTARRPNAFGSAVKPRRRCRRSPFPGRLATSVCTLGSLP